MSAGKGAAMDYANDNQPPEIARYRGSYLILAVALLVSLALWFVVGLAMWRSFGF
jgi:hypothetical protein